MATNSGFFELRARNGKERRAHDRGRDLLPRRRLGKVDRVKRRPGPASVPSEGRDRGVLNGARSSAESRESLCNAQLNGFNVLRNQADGRGLVPFSPEFSHPSIPSIPSIPIYGIEPLSLLL